MRVKCFLYLLSTLSNIVFADGIERTLALMNPADYSKYTFLPTITRRDLQRKSDAVLHYSIDIWRDFHKVVRRIPNLIVNEENDEKKKLRIYYDAFKPVLDFVVGMPGPKSLKLLLWLIKAEFENRAFHKYSFMLLLWMKKVYRAYNGRMILDKEIFYDPMLSEMYTKVKLVYDQNLDSQVLFFYKEFDKVLNMEDKWESAESRKAAFLKVIGIAQAILSKK